MGTGLILKPWSCIEENTTQNTQKTPKNTSKDRWHCIHRESILGLHCLGFVLPWLCTALALYCLGLHCLGLHARMPILPIECVLKIVTLKNFDGCTSCMPSSLKEYISP